MKLTSVILGSVLTAMMANAAPAPIAVPVADAGIVEEIVEAVGAADVQAPFKLFVANEDENDEETSLSKKKPLVDSETLQSLITAEALEKRAKKLYKIAKKSEKEFGHPTRVIGSPGHYATIGYIKKELKKLGGFYDVHTQAFKAVLGQIFEADLLINDEKPKGLIKMDLSPPTEGKDYVNGTIVLIANSGCDLSDYPEEVNGGIALVKRGTCSFGDKSTNAGLSGAIGAIVYNNEPGSIRGTLGTPQKEHVPTIGLDQENGDYYASLLANGTELEGALKIDSILKNVKTLNVIADSVQGNDSSIVALGAHSDSVIAGPGINDDGSGTISLLEVAKQLTKFTLTNKVRFAWWAAEEEGLLGSDYYVSQLTEEENSKIRLFMDYDMMASPNFQNGVYNASNALNPVGSEELKNLYIDWYLDHGLNYTLIPFDGRSDYVAFIDNGIPGGGIAAGAEGIKTKEEYAKYGGELGAWFDPCYHQLCDDLGNLNYTAFVYNTQLIAHSVATYARSLDDFPERDLSSFSISSESESESESESLFKYHGSKLIM